MVELGTNEKGSGRLSFSEIVGQEELKEALLAVVTNEALDGLLVRGEKGTAKSTAVRALADLLPPQEFVADCPYGCAPHSGPQCEECRERDDPPTEQRPIPLVTLPLGATRERVVGSLSVADALDGEYEFEPGLLARANRGILYVDEVNLLDDHLVDVLLDAAASGENRVERDGVSLTHPAAFTLVGTMNPEEGDLRPQLRDRFAMQATVTGCQDIDDRVAIIRQALDRDTAAKQGPETTGRASDAAVRERIARAKDLLADVALPEELAADVAQLCKTAGVDGHRGDIAVARGARTFAALEGRTTVLEADVRRAVELALPHRMQSRPFEDAPDTSEIADDFFDKPDGDDGEDSESGEKETEQNGDGSDDGGDDGAENAGAGPGNSKSEGGQDSAGGQRDSQNGSGDESDADGDDQTGSGESGGGERRPAGRPATNGATPDSGDSGTDDHGTSGDEQTPAETDDATPLVPGQHREVAGVGESVSPEVPTPDVSGQRDTHRTDGSARRARAPPSPEGRGARVRTEPADDHTTVDAPASVRAAARRGETTVGSRDLRQSVRTTDAQALVVFVVDASASMRPAMRRAKGTVLELLKDAYQQRDEVAFVTFAGESGEVLLPPTDSVTLAARHLKDLPTGDRTPLAAGLETATTVLDRADPERGVVVVVTDGRANVGESPVEATRAAASDLAQREASVLVVDAGDAGRPTLLDTVVDRTDATRVSLDALSADRVETAVRNSANK